MERRLAAILAADVVGYSSLMEADEEATARTLSTYLEIVEDLVASHHGRVFGSAGDSVVAEFPSPVEAVRCAVDIQRELEIHNVDLPEDRRMRLRIGVNLGDVMVEGDNLLGDGVNIAARLETLADAGGICLSRSVFDQIKKQLDLGYEYLGEHEVKNIAEPIPVYRVLTEPEAAGKVIGEKELATQSWKRATLVSAVAVLIGVAGAVAWLRPWEPRIEPASVERMALPLPDKPSIAVLPFINMSGDPEQEYFADGMTEDLITDLSKISGLFVIARNSTFTYKGKTVTIRQVAEELGVRYVLEGSVRRAGDQVRINAQLIDATTGGHVWAERYDSSLTNVFALQDKVTRNIVTALAVNLTVVERERQARRETDSPAAYDAFLRGWAHYRLYTPEDFAKAIPYFEEALRLDPNYGLAHAALAKVYWEIRLNDWVKSLGTSYAEVNEKARRHLEEAMGDPTPLAHRVAADMHISGERWDEAIAEAERAIALDANDPDGYVAMSKVLVRVGRPAEGLEFIETAMRLDPQYDYLWWLGDARFHQERYDEAAATMLRYTKRTPREEWGFFLLAAAYGQLGREQEARSAVETFNKLRAEVRQRPYTLADVGDWDFKEPADRERLREGLRKAGLPEGEAPPQVAPLAAAELRSLYPGNTIAGENRWWMQYHIYHAPDGKGFIRLSTGQTYEGNWEITDDGQKCEDWPNWGSGTRECLIIFKKGDEYEAWSLDDDRYIAKFKFLPGNPENLGAVP
jgi:TolB-like protein/class 3 adenylate cyclase